MFIIIYHTEKNKNRKKDPQSERTSLSIYGHPWRLGSVDVVHAVHAFQSIYIVSEHQRKFPLRRKGSGYLVTMIYFKQYKMVDKMAAQNDLWKQQLNCPELI